MDLRILIQDSGFRIQDPGYKIQGAGFKIQFATETIDNVSMIWYSTYRVYEQPCLVLHALYPAS